ncbi:hypothetical protein AKN90_01005 [Thiopseudomonas alkaliphila]|nr:hypothetical protein AKN90_01005 [Thiopseudomonas alkaliphila]
MTQSILPTLAAKNSNGLTEAINARLEHLRGTTLGFKILLKTPAGSWRIQKAATPLNTKSCKSIVLPS